KDGYKNGPLLFRQQRAVCEERNRGARGSRLYDFDLRGRKRRSRKAVPVTETPANSARGPGSGTAVPFRVKAPLKVVPPTISVPMRSQSGSRSALRIQLCRSGRNGVPGATIGLDPDSQKKLSDPANST